MLDRLTPPPVYKMGYLTLPTPQSVTLSNGMTLGYIDGGSQEVNQLTLIWHGGNFESKVRAIPRLMCHMMREGTQDLSGAEISEFLDFNGAHLKLASDGHITSLTLSSLNSKTINVLPLIRAIICNPTFPESALNVYKGIEAKELLISQSKVMNLSNQLLSKMIKGSDNPGAHVDTLAEVEGISRADVVDFYDRAITADGCRAFLSGLLTDELLSETYAMLGTLPVRGRAMVQNIMPYVAEAPGMHTVVKEGAVQAAVSIGLPAPMRSHPDYVPLRFAVIALGGYFGSRLMKNIREDKGYTYGIAAYLLGAQEGSYIMISAQTDPSHIEPLIDEVKTELVRLATEPMPQDELSRLCQYISSALMETLDSPFSIMDYYKTVECVGLPKGYFASQVDWVHRIDAAVIMEMARKYMDPAQTRIAICK